MSTPPEKPKKKSLWEILNTPVQDLVKQAPTEPAPPATEPVSSTATQTPGAAPPATPAAPTPAPEKSSEKPPEKAPEAAKTPEPGKAPETAPVPEVAKAPEPAAGPVPEAVKAPLEPQAAKPVPAAGPVKPEQAAESAPVAEPSPEPAVPDMVVAKSTTAPETIPQTAPPAETVATPAAKAEPDQTAQADPVPAEVAAAGTTAAFEATAEAARVEEEQAEEARKLRKKSLWEILNTPVQDLFKEGQLLVEEGEESDVAFLGLGRDKPVLEGSEKQSWLEHFKARLARTRSQFGDNITRLAKGRTKVDEDMLEELEEILLQSDVGVKTTDDVLEHLRGEAKKRRFLPEEVLPSLTAYLEQTLESEPFRLEEGKLNIFLIVGVNGTGKTTTVGKVAAKLKISGYKVMMAAGDTFRAAAIDQLAIWGKRVGCPVIQHHEGADAAAVVYDAIQSARAKKVDALLIDTAGRLHNKDYLMDELRKVHRIIEREKQDAHVENILVLDATTGQNGLRQAEVFTKSVPLNSLILTKLDGTAKGGVIFGIKRELGIPIKLLGVGEHLGDLQEFDPKSFVQALFAQDDSVGAEPAEVS